MRILAAIDGGRNSDRVVETAADLAEAYDDELVVVHVVSEERFHARQEGHPEYYQDDAVEDARITARQLVEDTLDTTADTTVLGRLGDPATEVLELAADLEPRYLVIGGRKRTPVGKALFGSVTQSVLLEADRPVVTVMAVGD